MKFKLFSVELSIPFLAIALMSVVVVLDTSYKFLACLLSAVIHESGHLFAMYLFSVKPKSITVKLFDFVIDADIESGFWSQFTITIMGPMFNLLFSLLLLPVSKLLSITNLCIGVFNLLPILSFDGGHALRLSLCTKFSSTVSENIVKAITFVLLVPLLFLGIMVLFYSKYNYSLLLISLYLVAILFTK